MYQILLLVACATVVLASVVVAICNKKNEEIFLIVALAAITGGIRLIGGIFAVVAWFCYFLWLGQTEEKGYGWNAGVALFFIHVQSYIMGLCGCESVWPIFIIPLLLILWYLVGGK